MVCQKRWTDKKRQVPGTSSKNWRLQTNLKMTTERTTAACHVDLWGGNAKRLVVKFRSWSWIPAGALTNNFPRVRCCRRTMAPNLSFMQHNFDLTLFPFLSFFFVLVDALVKVACRRIDGHVPLGTVSKNQKEKRAFWCALCSRASPPVTMGQQKHARGRIEVLQISPANSHTSSACARIGPLKASHDCTQHPLHAVMSEEKKRLSRRLEFEAMSRSTTFKAWLTSLSVSLWVYAYRITPWWTTCID